MTGPTRPRTRGAIALTVSLIAVALLFLVGTTHLAGEARIVPMTVLVPLIPLLGYALWRDLRSGPSPAPSAPTGAASDRWVLAWILALPALVAVAGLIAGSSLFVTGWLRRRSGEEWGASIASGLATAGALWLLAATVLDGLPLGGFLPALFAVSGY